jgi:hypothetical protein
MYEDWKVESSNVTRIGLVDLAQVVVDDESTTTAETTMVPYVHMLYLMAFSGFSPDRVVLTNGVFQGLAAVTLAIEHLNTRNSTLVREIDTYMDGCPIQFTIEALDTGQSESIAVNHVINAVGRPSNLPSVFLGTSRSATAIPTSIITGLKGYPQISPIATSTQLDDKTQFPLFGRTVPSDAGTAVPAVLYLRYELGITHLAVLHVNDSYGNAYAAGLQLAAAEYAPDMEIRSFDFPFTTTPEIIQQSVSLLKETQFRYFFGIFFSTVHYKPVMTEAYKQGIAGTGEHNWMFSEAVSTSIFADPFVIDSPLHLVSKGTSRIGAVGGVPGIPLYDRFLQSMNDLNNVRDIELIQSKHPTYDDEPDYIPYQIADDPDFFLKSTATVVPFVYDAAIAAGLAACEAYRISNNTTLTSSTGGDQQYFDGTTMFDAFKALSFEGVSGTNVYDPVTGTRAASSARFALQNFVEDHDYDDTNDPPGTIRLKNVAIDVFQDGSWVEVDPYVFNDGSTVPPPDLPVVDMDFNYLGRALRGMGYFMAVLVLVMSFGSMAWTYRKRKERVVKASQPIFLGLISTGCAFMGLAILLLSFDDEIASDDVVSAFCIAVPWLVTFGWILTFSAIFTKTNRVNKIFHNPQRLRRIKVTSWDVMKPFAVLLSVAGITLIVWTVVSPPVWEREVSQVDVFSREIESMGFCNYEESLPYAIILLIVLLGTVLLSLYEAFVARNISTEFAESDYIFVVLCVVVLVSFMGIPIMLIARDQPQARFFCSVCIIFIICFAVLLLIFGPKMVAHWRSTKQRPGSRMSTLPDRRISGNAPSIYGGRTHVSGLLSSADVPVSTEFRTSSDATPVPSVIGGDSESSSDEEGIQVLLHPKEVDGLKEQVRKLKKENKLLTASRRNLSALLEESKSHISSCDDPQTLLEMSARSGEREFPPVAEEKGDVDPGAKEEGTNVTEETKNSSVNEQGLSRLPSLDVDDVFDVHPHPLEG